MKIRTGLKLYYLVSLFFLCPAILWAKSVLVETARQVAVNRANKNIQSKALEQWRKGAALQQAVERVTAGQVTHTYTAMKNDISVYYVFNFSPEGWMIISADDAAWPVIGYSDSGFYDPNESSQPPALTAWMDNAAAQIDDAVAAGLQALPEAALAWQQLSAAPDDFVPDLDVLALAQSVSPLIQTTWGQGDSAIFGWECCILFGCDHSTSYNRYCPWDYTDFLHGCKDYCPTGCVATAMAQIMKYWQWPPDGWGWNGYNPINYCDWDCSSWGWREVNFADQTYDWSDSSMPLHGPSVPIALVMRDLGVAVKMEYKLDSSSSNIGAASDALHTYFRYAGGSVTWRGSDDTVWKNKLKADLDAARPVFYRGQGSGGHAFICDGYNTSDDFHFNWGWDGDYNGWFNINDLTPGDHNYTQDHYAIFGLAPFEGPMYVDDDYYDGGTNDTHTWGKDAFNSIQAAIRRIYSGGTVYVAPGRYNETIDLSGKAIHLLAVGGPKATTIHGHNAVHVVRCVSGEGPDTIIEGLTIRGGYARGTTSPDDRGAGIYIYHSSPTITNCIIGDNSAVYGAAMYNDGSNPTVINCTFKYNGAGEAGGMFNLQSCPTVTNCTFEFNMADGIAGGMYNLNDSSPIVTNCTFFYNIAGTCGGGMDNRVYSNPVVTNCVFTLNSADEYGGGMYNYQNNPTVLNCSFGSNTGGSGGGMYNNFSSPAVTNSILWGNTGGEIVTYYCTPVVTFSNVQGGWSGTGNINMDPLFTDPAAGDLHLQLNSSCIDAGSNAAVPAGVTESLDGFPRFVDACLPDTGSGTPPIVDMGAYEFLPADIDSTGFVNLGDWNRLAAHWLEDCGQDCQGADINCDGIVNLDDLARIAAWWIVGIE